MAAEMRPMVATLVFVCETPTVMMTNTAFEKAVDAGNVHLAAEMTKVAPLVRSVILTRVSVAYRPVKLMQIAVMRQRIVRKTVTAYLGVVSTPTIASQTPKMDYLRRAMQTHAPVWTLSFAAAAMTAVPRDASANVTVRH